MSKLLKNTVVYSLSNIFHQAINFILLPVYSKYLSPEQYGIVSSMLVIQLFIAILYSFSLEKGIIRMYWDYTNEKDRNTFLGTISISIFIISICMVVLTLLFKEQVSRVFPDINFYPYYLIVIINTFVITLSNIPLYYLRLKQKAVSYFTFSVVRMLLNTTFVLVLLISYKLEAKGVLMGQLLSNMAILFPLLVIVIKHIPLRFEKAMLKDGMRFSLPMIPSVMAGWVIGQMDRTIIAQHFSLTEVGIYSMAKKITMVLGFINTSFAMAYQPVFYELANAKSNNRKLLTKYNNAYIMFLLFATFMLIFLSNDVFNLLIDERYHMALQYIPIMAIAFFIGAIMSTILGTFFQQSKKMKADMYIGIVGAIIYISIFYYLIIHYGVYGAVFSSLISSALIFATAYIYTKKYCFFLPIDWKSILIISGIFLIFYQISIRINIEMEIYNLLKNVGLMVIMCLILYKLLALKFIRPFIKAVFSRKTQ